MSLKDKPKYIPFLIVFGLIVAIGLLVFFSPPRSQENTMLAEEESKDLRDFEYEELSPDGLNKIISYHFSFDTSIFRDYYKDYFDNDTVISVRDLENSRENYIFTGNRIGLPKWLGNEYVFFTSYCGTSCQGIYLVDISNKETKLGVLSYMTSEENKPVYTHFKDWFDREFKFNGWVDEIRADTIGNKTYLIFYMRDDKGKSIGQKRFLFTGTMLKE